MGNENSGRGQKPIDMEAALDLLMRGEKVPAIATELGISPPTLRKRIADIQSKQGLLLQYRSIQSLQLTELQARVLEAITPEKIEQAPLRDLIMSYKILKDKELDMDDTKGGIKGLVAHLIYLEKREQALANGQPLPDDPIQEAEFEEVSKECTSLSELDQQNF